MNVGLVAHDGKKNLMQNLCIAYQDILKKHKLYATSTTGQMIEDVANLKIHKLLAGHFGGMQQMGSKISNNEIDLLIFLQDPTNSLIGIICNDRIIIFLDQNIDWTEIRISLICTINSF